MTDHKPPLVPLLVFLLAVAAVRLLGAESLTGDTEIHDPSSIVKCGNSYWVFGTGRGIVSRYSTNLVDWHSWPSVFTHAPGLGG